MALPILSHFYRRRADATAHGERGLVRAKYLDASVSSVDAESVAKDARIRSVPLEPLVFGERETPSDVDDAPADSGALDVGPSALDGPEAEDAPDSFETYASGTFRAVRV